METSFTSSTSWPRHVGRAAAALIGDAEARLAERGVETAWLACAIGNHRAARFYEKSAGIFPLEVWRYEKRLPGITQPQPHHRGTKASS